MKTLFDRPILFAEGTVERIRYQLTVTATTLTSLLKRDSLQPHKQTTQHSTMHSRHVWYRKTLKQTVQDKVLHLGLIIIIINLVLKCSVIFTY